MTVRRALLFVLGVVGLGLLSMGLAKNINSVPIAWLIGWLTCALTGIADRLTFGKQEWW